VFAVYNMGMMNHPLGEMSIKVNDGKYHVVRFTRSGPNATLQIDNLPQVEKRPSGSSITYFFSMDVLIYIFHKYIAILP